MCPPFPQTHANTQSRTPVWFVAPHRPGSMVEAWLSLHFDIYATRVQKGSRDNNGKSAGTHIVYTDSLITSGASGDCLWHLACATATHGTAFCWKRHAWHRRHLQCTAIQFCNQTTSAHTASPPTAAQWHQLLQHPPLRSTARGQPVHERCTQVLFPSMSCDSAGQRLPWKRLRPCHDTAPLFSSRKRQCIAGSCRCNPYQGPIFLNRGSACTKT